ncbi:MAG: [ribosomal protein S5]-alanine N-acetyltransferase, partial [Gaiellaceae bacterium]|nr:[ribosomal protein S5]-alanine N-acetyltransferase [Gaiellaceae bacterium]
RELVGFVHLSGLARGPAQTAFLGYWIAQAANGRGYATEGVRLVVGYAFDRLRLHRVQAGVMPRNAGSLRVLEKVGFRREGLALRYLQINDVWEDHVILAVTAEEWPVVR